MTSKPISVVLTEFHPRGRSAASTPDAERSTEHARRVDALKREADLVRAYQDGVDAATREFEARAKADREVTEMRIREALVTQQRNIGQRLSDQIQKSINDLQVEIEDSLLKLLRPVIQRTVLSEAEDAVIREIRDALGASLNMTINVTAPQQVIDAIRTVIEPMGHMVNAVLSNDVDATIRINQTIIESQIGKWLKSFESDA